MPDGSSRLSRKEPKVPGQASHSSPCLITSSSQRLDPAWICRACPSCIPCCSSCLRSSAKSPCETPFPWPSQQLVILYIIHLFIYSRQTEFHCAAQAGFKTLASKTSSCLNFLSSWVWASKHKQCAHFRGSRKIQEWSSWRPPPMNHHHATGQRLGSEGIAQRPA